MRKQVNIEALRMFGILGMQVVLGYAWLSAGWEKASAPGFASGIGSTLGYFASKNPHKWYAAFLQGFATQNGATFAYAVEWGELLVGLTLLVTAAAIVYAKTAKVGRAAMLAAAVAFLAAMAMNANFYLAAGWTGPGTAGENVIMFWIQGIIAYLWLSAATLN